MALDISQPSSLDWTIAVSDEEVLKDTRFMFQFLPKGAAYDPKSSVGIASPGFNLLLVNQQSQPNGTAGATTTSTSETSSKSTSTSLSATSSSAAQASNPTSKDNGRSRQGMSAGAKTGIAIGVVFLVTIAAALIFRWMVHRRKVQQDKAMQENITGPYEILGDRTFPKELQSKETAVSESDGSPIYEISTTTKRPDLHELPT